MPRFVFLFLAVGIAAASQSGNIIRLAEASPLAIAAWRLVIASALLAPLAGGRLRQLRGLSRRDTGLLVLAGLALAAHFVSWIAAVQHTTVANAAIFFAINPVITALASHLVFGERLTPRLLGSMALGLFGVVAIGVSDFSLDRSQLRGDLLAVLSSVLFTAYFLIGKRLRGRLDNAVYVTALYGVAGAAGFAALFASGVPAAGYSPTTWLAFLLMALVPTMVGHSSMNYALKYVGAARISVFTLAEPLLAGLVAFFAWSEPVRPTTMLGYLLICTSVVVLVREKGAEVVEEAVG